MLLLFASLLELLAEVAKLTKERDLALQDSADLRDGMDDLQQMYDEDRAKLEEKLRKEIRAKERQIECLEEQLRGTTSNELKKLKRGIFTNDNAGHFHRSRDWQGYMSDYMYMVPDYRVDSVM